MSTFRNFLILWVGSLCIHASSAQMPRDAQLAQSRNLQRKIELLIRLRYEVPTGCDIKLGPRTPSPFTGYDRLRVTITSDGQSTSLDFLVSQDNRSLARLENFDLDRNPALFIDIRQRPIRGNPDAQVTVINFDDLECPVCARMHEILKSDIMQRYGGKVRFIYKDNPLTEIHPWAMHAAVDAGCLAQQDTGAYWTFIDYIHTHGQEVTGERRDLSTAFSTLDRLAGETSRGLRVNRPALEACLKKQDEVQVRQSMKEARDLGLDFTPALFVNGELVRGLKSSDDPERAVERALHVSNVR